MCMSVYVCVHVCLCSGVCAPQGVLVLVFIFVCVWGGEGVEQECVCAREIVCFLVYYAIWVSALGCVCVHELVGVCLQCMCV